MDTVDNTLSAVFKNKYSSTVLSMFLVFYSGLAAPKLPGFIVKLFDNAIFRILILALVVYNGNRDPRMALMIAVGFTVTMNILAKQKFLEGFADDFEDSELEEFTENDTEETNKKKRAVVAKKMKLGEEDHDHEESDDSDVSEVAEGFSDNYYETFAEAASHKAKAKAKKQHESDDDEESIEEDSVHDM